MKNIFLSFQILVGFLLPLAVTGQVTSQQITSEASDEGGWSGGGGSGVTCKDILEVLDYWEFNQEYIVVKSNDTPESYLERALLPMKEAAPLFYGNLLDALQRVEFKEFYNEIPKVDDVGKLMRPLESCELVPIAIRYAKITASGKARAFVHLNAKLYQDLGKNESRDIKIINQALLKLHEAIYLIGFELGQLTSEQTRKMSRVLMGAQLYENLRYGADVTSNTLGQIFSGFMSFMEFDGFASLYSNDLPMNNVLRIRQRGFIESIKRARDFLYLYTSEKNMTLIDFAQKAKTSQEFLKDFVIAGYAHDADAFSNEGSFAVMASVAEENQFVENSVAIYNRSQSSLTQDMVKKICQFTYDRKNMIGNGLSKFQQKNFVKPWNVLRKKALKHCEVEGYKFPNFLF